MLNPNAAPASVLSFPSAPAVVRAAAGNVEPYGCGVVPITLATAATGDVDFTVVKPFVIVEVVGRKVGAGGAGDTCTIKRAANAVTNAMDLNVSDNVAIRPTTFVAAQVAFAAGDVLRISRNTATNTGIALTIFVRAPDAA